MHVSRTVVVVLLWLAYVLPVHAEATPPRTLPLLWPKELPCKKFHDAVAKGQATVRWEFSGKSQPLEAPASEDWRKLADAQALSTRWTRVTLAQETPEGGLTRYQSVFLKLRCQEGDGPYLETECSIESCSLRAAYPGPASAEATRAGEKAKAARATTDANLKPSLARELAIEMLREVVRTVDVACTGQRCSETMKRLRSESMALQKSLRLPVKVEEMGGDAFDAAFYATEEDATQLSIRCGSWLDDKARSYDYCKLSYLFGSKDSANVTLSWKQSAIPERSVFFSLEGRSGQGTSGVDWTPSELILLNDAIRLR